MSCMQQMDELVKEYLLFRGFSGTVRALETDLKSEKDKAFRVSTTAIRTSDVTNMRMLAKILKFSQTKLLSSLFTILLCMI